MEEVGTTLVDQPQAEIVHVIEQAGLTPSQEDLTQLYQAITTFISDHEEADPAHPASKISFDNSTAQLPGDPDRTQTAIEALKELLSKACTTTTMNLYVNAATGDDENPGTEAEPKQTIQGALDAVPYVVAHAVTIHLADGTYADAVAIDRAVLDGASLAIQGNSASPSNVDVTGAVTISGTRLTWKWSEFSGATTTITINKWARVDFAKCHFTRSASGTAVSVDQGTIEFDADCVVNVSSGFVYAINGSLVQSRFASATVNGFLFSIQNGSLLNLQSNDLSVTQSSASSYTVMVSNARAVLSQDLTVSGGYQGLKVTNGQVDAQDITFTSSAAGGIGIYAGTNSFISCVGAISITQNTGSNNGTGILLLAGAILVFTSTITISGTGLLKGISVNGGTLSRAHGASGAIAVTCINSGSATGIDVAGAKLHLAGNALTLTGGGAGTAATLIDGSTGVYSSCTYAGTWGSNTNVDSSSYWGNGA